MADPHGNSPSKYHLIFGLKPSDSNNIALLTSINFIWDDYHIEKIKDNQWNCLWCDFTFQGVNTTKALAHVIGTKCMHIKRCTASIGQAHISIYKEFSKSKLPRKVY